MSRSVRMDYERYRNPIILFPCYECATLTTNLPDMSGVALCDQHKDSDDLVADVEIGFGEVAETIADEEAAWQIEYARLEAARPPLLFCDEVNSEFRRAGQ